MLGRAGVDAELLVLYTIPVPVRGFGAGCAGSLCVAGRPSREGIMGGRDSGAAMREPEAVRVRGVFGEGSVPVLVLRETVTGVRIPLCA